MTHNKMLKDLMTHMKMVDLSHTLEEHIPAWPTHTKYKHDVWSSLDLGDIASNYMILMNEHTGTHMDMPCHVFNEGEASKQTTETITLDHFNGPYKKIDCSHFTPGETLEKADVLLFEALGTDLESGDVVLLDFGWAKYWQLKPNDKKFLDQWPGIGASAAEYFVSKKVKMVGVDTIAADVFAAEGSPAHRWLLGNGICIIENLNNLSEIPSEGYFMSMPLKMRNGTGSPVRAFALCEPE